MTPIGPIVAMVVVKLRVVVTYGIGQAKITN